VPLSDFSSTSSLQVQLPRGTPLEVGCTVRALIGDQATEREIWKNVTVTAKPMSDDGLKTMVDSDIKAAMDQQDKWGALRLVASVGACLSADKPHTNITSSGTRGAIREQMMNVLGQVSASEEPSSVADIDQMANSLKTVTDEPDELSESTINKTFGILDTVFKDVRTLTAGAANLMKRVRQPLADSISNAMSSSSKPEHTAHCKAEWTSCLRAAKNSRLCADARRACIKSRNTNVDEGVLLLNKLVAEEMKGRLPSEGEVVLQTPAVTLQVTKVLDTDIGNGEKSKFTSRSGSKFKLPAAIKGKKKKKCSEGDAVCGMNIVVQTWNPAVHGNDVLAPGMDSANVSDTLGMGSLATAVTSMSVREDDDESEAIDVSGLDDSADGAVEISLKVDASLMSAKQGETYEKSCVWFDAATESFKSDGCTLVSQEGSDEVTCRCTHLTDFALWIKLKTEAAAISAYDECVANATAYGQNVSDVCGARPTDSVLKSNVEKYSSLTIGCFNYLLALIVLMKMLRFTIPKMCSQKSLGDVTRAMSVIDYQCILVFFTTIIRGSVALCKFLEVITNDNLTLSAVLMMLPMIFGFWAASLTIASWASIVHKTIKKGSHNPVSGMTLYYLGFNVLDIVFVGTCWAMILTSNHSDLDRMKLWAKLGETALAAPEIILAVAALIYGSILIGKINDSMRKFASRESDQKVQLKAVQKTALIMAVFAFTYLCQGGLDFMVGWFPSVYDIKVKIGDTELYAVSPIEASHALCSLVCSTIIVFVTVKYEEIAMIAHEVATPLRMLGESVSSLFPSRKSSMAAFDKAAGGYQPVPQSDPDTPAKGTKEI